MGIDTGWPIKTEIFVLWPLTGQFAKHDLE